MQINPELKVKAGEDYAEFVIEPLQKGFGVTLGNPLRRILLSSIPGTAVTSVYIEDVLHEFSTIDGVKEDVMQIILNLKNLVVKLHQEEAVTLTLRAEEAGDITAAAFDVPATAEIVNPDLHIATLAAGGSLVMEVRVEAGIGHIPAEVHGIKDRINSIPVDAVYSPVERVAFRVENTRVGQRTDLDRLILRVWTDGSVAPQDAVSTAVDILKGQLNVFGGEAASDIDTPDVNVVPVPASTQEEESKPVAETMSLEHLELTNRVLHALQEEGIESVAALLELSERELKKVAGIGEKAFAEIIERLDERGLKLKE